MPLPYPIPHHLAKQILQKTMYSAKNNVYLTIFITEQLLCQIFMNNSLESIPVSSRMPTMEFVYNDGGKPIKEGTGREWGYKVGYCRAIAIITGLGYSKVYNDLKNLINSLKARHRQGFEENKAWQEAADKYLESLDFKWTPTKSIGMPVKTH
jgi:hypothetical protein